MHVSDPLQLSECCDEPDAASTHESDCVSIPDVSGLSDHQSDDDDDDDTSDDIDCSGDDSDGSVRGATAPAIPKLFTWQDFNSIDLNQLQQVIDSVFENSTAFQDVKKGQARILDELG